MDKVKIGVFGGGRGQTMMRYCVQSENSELVAICDKNHERIQNTKKIAKKCKCEPKFFSDFDDFLANGGMDAVVLANYADDHAPYAIKCLKAGKHVLSEVLPVANLKEAVELCEAVESSGKIYAYAENYCYISSVREIKRLVENGTIGRFEYGEGEYMHNCQPGWEGLTAGYDPTHWRNRMSGFYYCTHSAGPLLYMSGKRPVKVSGIEGLYNNRMKQMTAQGASVAVEMITLEDGAICKSLHGVGPSESSIWYNVYGENGKAESGREYAGWCINPLRRVYVVSGNTPKRAFTKWRRYFAPMDFKAKRFGHGGSDWYIMKNFTEKIQGNNDASTIDVYQALDMFFVGHFGYLSAREGGKEMEIPDFRYPAIREKYRNDTTCCNPDKAGDMFIPARKDGKN